MVRLNLSFLTTKRIKNMNIQDYISKKYCTSNDVNEIVEKCKKYISFANYDVSEDALKFNDVTVNENIVLEGTEKNIPVGTKLAALDFTNTGWMKVYENDIQTASYIIIGNPILEALYNNQSPDLTTAWSQALPHIIELINIIKQLKIADIRTFESQRGQSLEERIFTHIANEVITLPPEEVGTANGV